MFVVFHKKDLQTSNQTSLSWFTKVRFSQKKQIIQWWPWIRPWPIIVQSQPHNLQLYKIWFFHILTFNSTLIQQNYIGKPKISGLYCLLKTISLGNAFVIISYFENQVRFWYLNIIANSSDLSFECLEYSALTIRCLFSGKPFVNRYFIDREAVIL